MLLDLAVIVVIQIGMFPLPAWYGDGCHGGIGVFDVPVEVFCWSGKGNGVSRVKQRAQESQVGLTESGKVFN